MPLTLQRSLRWTAGIVAGSLAIVVLLVWLLGWNWLRGPIERTTLEKTGRVLVIAGDVQVRWGWPLPHITFGQVRFANPSWAMEPQMVQADAVEVSVHLPELLRGNVCCPRSACSRRW